MQAGKKMRCLKLCCGCFKAGQLCLPAINAEEPFKQATFHSANIVSFALQAADVLSCRAGKKTRCNCKKTQCLKLYCECFKAGQLCIDCSCQGCVNTPNNTCGSVAAAAANHGSNGPDAQQSICTWGTVRSLHKFGLAQDVMQHEHLLCALLLVLIPGATRALHSVWGMPILRYEQVFALSCIQTVQTTASYAGRRSLSGEQLSRSEIHGCAFACVQAMRCSKVASAARLLLHALLHGAMSSVMALAAPACSSSGASSLRHGVCRTVGHS